MRAIRSRGWVAEELIRELTIAELGCKGDTENLLAQKLPLLSSRLIEQLKYCEKGQDLTSLGEMGLGSLPPLTVTINN